MTIKAANKSGRLRFRASKTQTQWLLDKASQENKTPQQLFSEIINLRMRSENNVTDDELQLLQLRQHIHWLSEKNKELETNFRKLQFREILFVLAVCIVNTIALYASR